MTKIAFLGDWQYSQNDLEILQSCIDDINVYSPDCVVQLGDYGTGKQLGTSDGIVESAKMFSRLKCAEFIPILGNHDLQNETGKSKFKHGYIENVFKNAFNLKDKNRILEFDDFRIFAFGLEPQPEESFFSENECYMSNETISLISDKIRSRPNVSVIMCTHAPIIGCGLRTVPFTHVRACNAFLNQNHDPYNLVKLAAEHDEIKLWFSGHYHLGQSYENSHTYKYGTHFFSVGVVSSASRDGTRHSRFLEIDNEKACVYTYDHVSKKMLCDEKISLVEKSTVIRQSNSCPSESDLVSVFDTASGQLIKNGAVLGKNGMLYVLTDQWCVWEINLKYGEAMGTLNYSDTVKISEIFAEDEGILCVTNKGNRLFAYNEPHRFMTEKNSEQCVFKMVARKHKYFDPEAVDKLTVNLENNLICHCLSGEFIHFEISKQQS